MFKRQVKVQIGKSTLIILIKRQKRRLWLEMNTFPWKIYGAYPSETDVKVPIPAPIQKKLL